VLLQIPPGVYTEISKDRIAATTGCVLLVSGI